MTRKVVHLLPLLFLALTACGNDSAEKTQTAPTSVESSTSAPAPSSTLQYASVADAEKAHSLVLQQSEFPPGWTSSPHKESASGQETGKQLSACVGRPDSATYETADVHGPDFEMGTGTSALKVESDATYVKTRADAEADFAALSGPKLPGCFKDLFGKTLEGDAATQGVSLKSSAFDAQPVAQQYGDGTVRYRLTATLQGPRGEATIYLDLVAMFKDRAEVDAIFSTFGQPFPAELEDSLVSALGNKLAAA